MMRSLGLSLVAFASLAACTETGAHLTLSAPDGPSNATTFRVVLATPEQVPSIRNQRLAPGDWSTTSVQYYLQRTVAGGETNEAIDDVDGFTVRIAPDTALAENSFIPFVLMYDSNGRIEAIGTYRAGDAPPSAIRVATDVIDKYTVNVERTVELTNHSLELQPGEVRVITCEDERDQTQYTSGIAWHTLGGEQYRLLFPNDGGLDATGRMLDLDCDGYEVTAESSHRDCDDTRDAYNHRATEICDLEDTNCDGAQTTTKECSDVPAVCIDPFGGPPGVRLCNETTGVETTCQLTAACSCAASQGGNGCHVCYVPFEHSIAMPNVDSVVHPCQPAHGMFKTNVCTELATCDVEVVAVRNDWKVKISATTTGSFGSRADNVGADLALKVERNDGIAGEVTAGPLTPIGDFFLVFTTANATVYTPVELKLQELAQTCPIAPATAMLYCL